MGCIYLERSDVFAGVWASAPGLEWAYVAKFSLNSERVWDGTRLGQVRVLKGKQCVCKSTLRLLEAKRSLLCSSPVRFQLAAWKKGRHGLIIQMREDIERVYLCVSS